MREIYTVQDGWGIQCFSTWEALRKYLFVLCGRFANQPDTGYKNGLSFDTDNPTADEAYDHGTPATARRVKRVLDAGFQCTLVDDAHPHPQHITITPTPLYTANDMEAHWHHIQQETKRKLLTRMLGDSSQTAEDS